MVTNFSLVPKDFVIPSLKNLRREWQNITDKAFQETIVREYQYFKFLVYVLNSLHYTSEIVKNPRKISFDLRASFIKSAIISASCIMEAVLLFHAQKRNYKDLHKNEEKRTFGNIINAWKKDSNGSKEIGGQNLELLEVFLNVRNHIHISKSAKNEHVTKKLGEKEQSYLIVLDHLINFMKQITSQ